jgi:centrosomal protein CEP104
LNKYNLFNQVGIIAVNLLGSNEVRRVAGDGGMSDMIMGNAGGVAVQFGANALNDLSVDMNLDGTTAGKLRQLADAKNRAIASEDYALAKVIKSVESELKSMGGRLGQLDLLKKRAVASEDYDKAREFKDEMDTVRLEIEEKVRNIHIVGVTDDVEVAPNVPLFAPVGTGYSQQPRSGTKVPQQFAPDGLQGSPQSTLLPDDQPMEDMGDITFQSSARPNKPKAPLNVDDIVVGKGSSGQMNIPEYPPDTEFDRPIRTQQNYGEMEESYAEQSQGGIVDKGDRFEAAVDDTFPDGQHPLEGVPDMNEMPHPEQLAGRFKEYADQTRVTALLGEYRTKCLFSKMWQLREAAIRKVRLMMKEGGLEGFGGDGTAEKFLSPLGVIGKIGTEDKIAQVLFASLSYVKDLLEYAENAHISKNIMAPIVEPIMITLIEKLNDGGARIREASSKGLRELAASHIIGHIAVASQLLRPIPPKQKGLWRPLHGRLLLLIELLDKYGLAGSFNVDSVMNFCIGTKAFEHSKGEVRDEVKTLIVKLQSVVGTSALDGHLKKLGQQRQEELFAAFEGKERPSATRAPLNTNNQPKPKKDMGGEGKSSSEGRGGGGGHHTPHQAKHSSDKNENAGDDFTTCMFCGENNPIWDEEALDLHYWTDCPHLTACPACAQVVEIAGLPQHLLEECENKDNYRPCEKTGLAIKKTDYDEWIQGDKCTAPPDQSMLCPLCTSVVLDSDDAWNNHLLKECPQNRRRKSN